MTVTVTGVFDELAEYRDKYREQNLDVPHHEIVLRSDKHEELMDCVDAVHYIDHTLEFRNFGGAAIVIDNSIGPHPVVRDRTTEGK